MESQQDRASDFRALHRPGDPLVLVNVWDVGSALTVAGSGADALATSSWAVARARGFDDGEQTPLDDVLALIRGIVAAVPQPMTVDLEGGYGRDTGAVRDCVAAAIDAGAVGCNLEDTRPDSAAILPAAEQARRLAAARRAADDAGVAAFVNARTDVFLRDPAAGRAGLDDVLARAAEYADAGADGLFVPGLTDPHLVRTLVKGSSLPVNVMVDPEVPLDPLAAAGVARISFGASSYLAAMATLAGLGQRDERQDDSDT